MFFSYYCVVNLKLMFVMLISWHSRQKLVPWWQHIRYLFVSVCLLYFNKFFDDWTLKYGVTCNLCNLLNLGMGSKHNTGSSPMDHTWSVDSCVPSTTTSGQFWPSNGIPSSAGASVTWRFVVYTRIWILNVYTNRSQCCSVSNKWTDYMNSNISWNLYWKQNFTNVKINNAKR